MERNNYIPEDQIARYDAMGNPVAKPGWGTSHQRKGNFLVNENVDKQIREILEGEFTINPILDAQIKEIMQEELF